MVFGRNDRFDFTTPLPQLADATHVHFIAIGGSGMVGIAKLFLGYRRPDGSSITVTGSDRAESERVSDVREHGATVTIGQSAQTARDLPDGAWVVVSTAIREDNPELQVARARGLLILHRSQAIVVAMDGREAVAVTGTNGKTTTSSMATVAMRACGLDPSFITGAAIGGIGASSGAGQGDYYVAEVDESDGSFVVYHPKVAIVTSIREDHLDFWGDLETMFEGYVRFADTIQDGGLLVACADEVGSARLAQVARDRGIRTATYGHGAGADLQLTQESLGPDEWAATVRFADTGEEHLMRVQIPGAVNLMNAASVVLALSEGLGVARDRAVWAVGEFTSVKRRFELRGTPRGIRVIDDYAHNADKVAALVQTGVATKGDGKVIAVFQPHLFTRTQRFAQEFADAMVPADVAIVMDVAPSREDPIPGVTGAVIADRILGTTALYTPTDDATIEAILQHAAPGDLVLLAGSGYVTTIVPRIVASLQSGHLEPA